MSTTVIVLIVIGVVFIIGSFFVKETLSKKDIDAIAKMSENEIKVILEKKLNDADTKIEDSLNEIADNSLEDAKRDMEKTTNEKIMAISEFSDTVLDSMNKTHNEIMFLYSMLNDKHSELTELAGDLQHFSSSMKDTENEILAHLSMKAEEIESKALNFEAPTEEEVNKQLFEEEEPDKRSNEEILRLHKLGKTDVEIAKSLGRGLGEVKLVIGLYQEEEKLEA